MKKFLSVLLLFTLAGCASIPIPNYIRDKHPYKQKYFAEFDVILPVVQQTLADFGWIVAGEEEPATFETAREVNNPNHKQVMLFTDVRQTALFIGSRYSRMNVYLRGRSDKTTEVEIRYMSVSSVLFRNFQGYRRDAAVKKVFARIDKYLEEKKTISRDQ